MTEPLLGPDALKGLRIAISASESPDLGRLGLVETHYRLAVAEIARAVLISGGKLCYGGHLDPAGYTSMLVHELQRFSRRDKPLQICLAWQEHRKLSQEQFDQQKNDLGLFGEIVCLDPEGKPFTWGPQGKGEPENISNEALRQRSLTALRQFMARNTHARVLIGGRREGFQGRMPGLLEEALTSIEAEQPLYLAGGFGGVTVDIIKTVGLDDATWLPARSDALPQDDRVNAGLSRLSETLRKIDPKRLSNGLSAEENRRLAATHRPSEIAALVSLGLGRRFPERQNA
jgi:hypothetical protein